MREMRGWVVTGIMVEVTFFPSAESVRGWQGVVVWMSALIGGKRVARPEETGHGWKWRWSFPW